jgi:hypothetical protein
MASYLVSPVKMIGFQRFEGFISEKRSIASAAAREP